MKKKLKAGQYYYDIDLQEIYLVIKVGTYDTKIKWNWDDGDIRIYANACFREDIILNTRLGKLLLL